MAAFVGKWRLMSSQLDNVDAFMKALGYSDEIIEYTKVANRPENNVVIEYSLSGDTVTDTMCIQDSEIFRYQFQLGQENVFTDKAKKVSKLKSTVNGNTMLTTQKLGDLTATYTNTAEGNTMTQVMQTGSVKVERLMKRIE